MVLSYLQMIENSKGSVVNLGFFIASQLIENIEAMDEDEVTALKATVAALKEKLARGKSGKKKGKRSKYRTGSRAVAKSRQGSRRVAQKTAKAELKERAKALMDERPSLRLVDAKRNALKADPKLRERLNAEG